MGKLAGNRHVAPAFFRGIQTFICQLQQHFDIQQFRFLARQTDADGEMKIRAGRAVDIAYRHILAQPLGILKSLIRLFLLNNLCQR